MLINLFPEKWVTHGGRSEIGPAKSQPLYCTSPPGDAACVSSQRASKKHIGIVGVCFVNRKAACNQTKTGVLGVGFFQFGQVKSTRRHEQGERDLQEVCVGTLSDMVSKWRDGASRNAPT